MTPNTNKTTAGVAIPAINSMLSPPLSNPDPVGWIGEGVTVTRVTVCDSIMVNSEFATLVLEDGDGIGVGMGVVVVGSIAMVELDCGQLLDTESCKNVHNNLTLDIYDQPHQL